MKKSNHVFKFFVLLSFIFFNFLLASDSLANRIPNCGGRFQPPCTKDENLNKGRHPSQWVRPQKPRENPRTNPRENPRTNPRENPRLRTRPVDPRRPMRQPDLRQNNPFDRDAYAIIDDELRTQKNRCEDMGNLLVRVSNRMVRMAQILKKYDQLPPQNALEKLQYDMALRSIHHREFWERMWDRLANVYRQCEVDCFDSGTAIGQMSGIGYCSASVGAGGLDGIGFTHTPPLPVCEKAVTIACQSGYREAARSYPGCERYTESGYSDIFREYLSQDCSVAE